MDYCRGIDGRRQYFQDVHIPGLELAAKAFAKAMRPGWNRGIVDGLQIR